MSSNPIVKAHDVTEGFSSGSSDSDGQIDSYSWQENGTEIAAGVNPTVDLLVGTHTITLVVTDDDGATGTDEMVITVVSGTSVDNCPNPTGTERALTGYADFLDVANPVLTQTTASEIMPSSGIY